MNTINLSKRIILLDRDGVINEDSDEYIKSVDEWIPIPGSLEAIAQLSQADFKVFVITNQSGLGRGLFSQANLDAMHDKLHTLLKHSGGHIEGIYYCPHIPEDHCSCRKPETGLLQQLAKEHALDLTQVPFVGDSKRDIDCANQFGCRGVLVKTGKGETTLEKNPELNQEPVFESLAHFVSEITKHS